MLEGENDKVGNPAQVYALGAPLDVEQEMELGDIEFRERDPMTDTYDSLLAQQEASMKRLKLGIPRREQLPDGEVPVADAAIVNGAIVNGAEVEALRSGQSVEADGGDGEMWREGDDEEMEDI